MAGKVLASSSSQTFFLFFSSFFFLFFFGGGANTDLLEMELLFEEMDTFVDILIVQGLDLEFSEFEDGSWRSTFSRGSNSHTKRERKRVWVQQSPRLVIHFMLSHVFPFCLDFLILLSVVSDGADGP